MIIEREKQTFIGSEMILDYFISTEDNDELNTLIMCKPPHINLTTSDQALYEALGSISETDKFNWRKLVKFLESVDVISQRYSLKKKKLVLSEAYVRRLRTKMLEGNKKVEALKVDDLKDDVSKDLDAQEPSSKAQKAKLSKEKNEVNNTKEKGDNDDTKTA